jgi:hypothetical protein
MIVGGDNRLFDFGQGTTEIRQVIAVIRHLRFSASCVVSRLDGDFDRRSQ